jgi:Domain of unknown function (DUF5655)
MLARPGHPLTLDHGRTIRCVSTTQRELWTCPKCGNAFVTRNMSHSCANVPLERHFEGRPNARRMYELYKAAVERGGPVTVVSSKTRIAFMTRARFAGVVIRKDYVRASLWLKRRVEPRKPARIEQYGARDYVYYFDLREPADIDDELLAMLDESRTVGDQRSQADRR